MTNPSSLLPGLNVRRVVAFVVDHFIITILTTIPLLLFMLNSILQEVNDVNSMFSMFYIAMAIAFCLYLLKDCYRGKSLGKSLVGLSVKTYDGHHTPSISSLIVRNLLTFIWPLELLMLVVSKDKRKLGDRIANTAIFYSEKKISWLVKLSIPIISFTLFICFLVFMTSYILKNDGSYKTSVEFIKTNPDVRSHIGDIVGFGFIPMGSVSITNGRGEAYFDIKVKGTLKATHINIKLHKEPNQVWMIKDYTIK